MSEPRMRPRAAWHPYALLLPTVLVLGTFFVYPLLLGLYRSFFRWDLLAEPVFVGVGHYRSLFASGELVEIVGRTLATLKGEALPAGATVLYRLEDETEDKATAIKRLTAYEALLYRWMNTPMEGTRRTPGAPDN